VKSTYSGTVTPQPGYTQIQDHTLMSYNLTSLQQLLNYVEYHCAKAGWVLQLKLG